jgi:hypothetical protein
MGVADTFAYPAERPPRKCDCYMSWQRSTRRLTTRISCRRRGAPFRDLFHVKHNPCQAYSGGQGQLLKVVEGGRAHPLREQSTISIIHPSVLPSGAGVQFIATPNTGYLQTSPDRFALGVLLVQTSRKRTGS